MESIAAALFRRWRSDTDDDDYPSIRDMGIRFGSGLKDEKLRLLTFKKMASRYKRKINPKALARFGFYFCGYEDFCRCHFCRLELYSFRRNDDPLEIHMRKNPNCPLLVLSIYESGNVMKNAESSRTRMQFYLKIYKARTEQRRRDLLQMDGALDSSGSARTNSSISTARENILSDHPDREFIDYLANSRLSRIMENALPQVPIETLSSPYGSVYGSASETTRQDEVEARAGAEGGVAGVEEEEEAADIAEDPPHNTSTSDSSNTSDATVITAVESSARERTPTLHEQDIMNQSRLTERRLRRSNRRSTATNFRYIDDDDSDEDTVVPTTPTDQGRDVIDSERINGDDLVRRLAALDALQPPSQPPPPTHEVPRRPTAVVSQSPQLPTIDETPENGENLCIICTSKKYNILYYPCGHLCVCSSCDTFIDNCRDSCIICRRFIGDRIKVFMA